MSTKTTGFDTKGLRRHLVANSGDANQFARDLSAAPKWMRAKFAKAMGEESKSATLWGKPDGTLNEALRAERLSQFIHQRTTDFARNWQDWFADRPTAYRLLDGFKLSDGEAEATEADEPKAPKAPKAPKGGSKADDQFQAVWDAMGIPRAVEAALRPEIAKIVEAVRSEVKVVKYEVHDKGEVRDVPGLKHEVFEEVLDVMTAGQFPWLYGPSGTGKTSMAAQLAEALGQRYAGLSASPGMSGAEFDGWLLPMGEHGRFEHVESVFLDFVENGGVFLIDEIANLPPDVATKLNMLMANGETWISKRREKPRLVKSKDFYLIAADNTAGRGGDRRYVRQQQDSALRNRFTFVRVGYDTNMERELFGDDKQWLDRVHELRSKAAKAKLVEEVGLRQIGQGYTLRKTHGKDKWSIDRCLQTITAGWSDDDRAKVGLAK